MAAVLYPNFYEFFWVQPMRVADQFGFDQRRLGDLLGRMGVMRKRKSKIYFVDDFFRALVVLLARQP